MLPSSVAQPLLYNQPVGRNRREETSVRLGMRLLAALIARAHQGKMRPMPKRLIDGTPAEPLVENITLEDGKDDLR